MSTLQHSPQQTLGAHRNVVLAALFALVAAAALTIVLIASSGSTSSSPITGNGTGVVHGTPQQQLSVLSGARFGAAHRLP